MGLGWPGTQGAGAEDLCPFKSKMGLKDEKSKIGVPATREHRQKKNSRQELCPMENFLWRRRHGRVSLYRRVGEFCSSGIENQSQKNLRSRDREPPAGEKGWQREIPSSLCKAVYGGSGSFHAKADGDTKICTLLCPKMESKNKNWYPQRWEKTEESAEKYPSYQE